jgi:hypothetical protein
VQANERVGSLPEDRFDLWRRAHRDSIAVWIRHAGSADGGTSREPHEIEQAGEAGERGKRRKAAAIRMAVVGLVPPPGPA